MTIDLITIASEEVITKAKAWKEATLKYSKWRTCSETMDAERDLVAAITLLESREADNPVEVEG